MVIYRTWVIVCMMTIVSIVTYSALCIEVWEAKLCGMIILNWCNLCSIVIGIIISSIDCIDVWWYWNYWQYSWLCGMMIVDILMCDALMTTLLLLVVLLLMPCVILGSIDHYCVLLILVVLLLLLEFDCYWYSVIVDGHWLIVVACY